MMSLATSSASINVLSFSHSERHLFPTSVGHNPAVGDTHMDIWLANHVTWKGRLVNKSPSASPRRSIDIRTRRMK